MKKNTKNNIIFFVMIISGFFMFITSYDVFVSDKNIIDSFNNDILNIYLYNKYENKFNYFHGLWLIPTGIFFVFLLVFLDIPSFEDIYKKIKKDFRKKFKIFFLVFLL